MMVDSTNRSVLRDRKFSSDRENYAKQNPTENYCSG
jgi:hypothetical protein